MKPNLLVMLAAALVPLIIGYIWYNPSVFGNTWMKETGMTHDKAKSGHMAKIFILTFIFSFMIALILNVIVIHQYGIYSILANDPGMKDPNSDISKYVADFMSKYGSNFRTFKHGAFHGTLTGIFLILPAIGVNSLFEQRSGKYILVAAGFWVVCFALMGGIICQWS